MTGTPKPPEETPEERPEAPVDEPKQRFNPFAHEEDMFKVVLATGAFVLLAILVATLARAIF